MVAERKMTDEDADKIDAYLGRGTYDRWAPLDAEGRMLLGKKQSVGQALWKADQKVYAVLNPFGCDYVDKVRQDMIAGWDLLLASKFPDPEQFAKMFKLYELSVDTADLLIQEGETIPIISLILGATAVKTLGLATSAARLRNELMRLDALLSEAHYQKIEAQIQQAFGIVTNTISLVLPGLSLLAKGTLTAADFMLDNHLGPEKPPLEDKAGNAAKGGGLVMDMVEKVKSVSEAKKNVAGKAGKVLTVTGFVFDYREVQLANENLEAIKKKMAECQKLYDDFKERLKKWLPIAKEAHERMEGLVRPLRKKALDIQHERDKLIWDMGYSSGKAFPWKIVSDLSRAELRGVR